MSRRENKKRYELYFTNDEWKKINWLVKQYNSKDIASFVRNRVLNGKIVVESIPSKDEVISEIKQVGNNINQIARKLNSLSKNTVATKQDMLQAKLLAKQCLEEQKKMYKMISKKLYIIHEEVTDYDSDI
ncbi:plasmid mobilization protein [Thomasclavelia ramosa]|uniref:plasmid mobilization protein n=1 Tax=Thomasclavelia ramosa TaxID=1547 RepID=UPI00189FB1BE|nr:plasmid mobilization relaxosome protein MobC [Thomasclavelia ramosa]